jgi:hypothetical protein
LVEEERRVEVGLVEGRVSVLERRVIKVSLRRDTLLRVVLVGGLQE